MIIMGVLDINLNVIKKELNKEITIEELEEILFKLGLEIEGVEENILKIDITAERSDLLSPNGFLRALKAYCGVKDTTKYVAQKSNYVVHVDKSVQKVRPYTVCAVVQDLKINHEKIKEIIWAQEKLHQTLGRNRKEAAIGIYPFSKISFPVSYLAKPKSKISFVPLGFNKDMSVDEIIKKTTAGKEYSFLIKDQESCALFIDSNNKILSMPPIINSQETGQVTTETKEVFIECSGYNLKRLNQILNIIVCMFIDFGGTVHSVEVTYLKKEVDFSNKTTIARSLPYLVQEKQSLDMSYNTPDLSYKKINVSLNNMNALLGTNIETKQAIELLEKMNLFSKKKKKDILEVLIPPYRTDILHEVDVADDLSRAYGFSNISLRHPSIYTIGELTKKTELQDKIINTMTSLGFQEVIPLALSSKKEMVEHFCVSDEDVVYLGYSKDKTVDAVVSWLPIFCRFCSYKR